MGWHDDTRIGFTVSQLQTKKGRLTGRLFFVEFQISVAPAFDRNFLNEEQKLQSIFGNGVDPKFIGIPPFPQKKAERVGYQ
jgi:hypothetical protein